MPKIKVVIDPAHGGEDKGGRGSTGYAESDITLKIATLLAKELISTNQFDVFLTRNSDKHVSMNDRVYDSINYGADLFISEHTKGSVNNAIGLQGSLTYYCGDVEDRILAAYLSKATSNALGIPDNGCHLIENKKYGTEEYYSILRKIEGNIPHVILIENAIRENPEGDLLFKDEMYLVKLARAQAKTICNFYKIPYSRAPVQPVPNVPTARYPTLKHGDISVCVEELQYLLKELGYVAIEVDGEFSNITESCVKNFKRAHQETEHETDGVVDLAIWQKIKELVVPMFKKPDVLNERPVLKRDDENRYVFILQEKLMKIGYAVTNNGKFDFDTALAISRFQRKHRLKQDLIVGPETWAMLDKLTPPATDNTEEKEK